MPPFALVFLQIRPCDARPRWQIARRLVASLPLLCCVMVMSLSLLIVTRFISGIVVGQNRDIELILLHQPDSNGRSGLDIRRCQELAWAA